MHSTFDFGDTDQTRMVYIRAVDRADLPKEVRDQTADMVNIYAVHDAEGHRLALVADRKLAFALARQHNMAPMSVH
jgi:hypothetical protein